ncbi:acyl transferase/acyl hydrolase/lysophospholipase [Hypomontagnella monticulosa]|nr:acyl transferase/acyl hydrolase/lysophospholipase [Hypomontagnella monticulosa]
MVSEIGPDTPAPSSTRSINNFPLRGYQNVSDEYSQSPWAKKTVLSFDGGGIRGYSSLLILENLIAKIKEIETEISKSEIRSSADYPWMATNIYTPDTFLPCHYFDYIAGTSTGGLSAIMLGRLRMTVEEALSQYKEFGNAVFGKARWWNERSLPPLWFPRAKYASKKARAAFKKIIYNKMVKENRKLFPYHIDTVPFKYRKDRTRTIVFSFFVNKKTGVSNVPYLWRTYDHEFETGTSDDDYPPLNPSLAHITPIWQVARATSAAPTYFESIKLGHEKHLDGGMGANNPSLFVLQEIRSKHGRAPALFLSIGCGKNSNVNQAAPEDDEEFRRTFTVDSGRRKQFLKKWLEIGRSWKHFMTDTEGHHGVDGWKLECIAMNVQHRCRLNVEGRMRDIPLDDWDPPTSGEITLNRIRKETVEYLEKPEVQKRILDMARELVNIRRQRAETERWEVFASDVTYCCPNDNCRRSHNMRYKTRHHARQHVTLGCEYDRKTNITDAELEHYLNTGRRFPSDNIQDHS